MAVADTSSTARTHVGEIDNHLTGGRMIRLQRRTPSVASIYLNPDSGGLHPHDRGPTPRQSPKSPQTRLGAFGGLTPANSRRAVVHHISWTAERYRLVCATSSVAMTSQQEFRHSSPTFGELIGRQGQCFYVPTYQRGFTWGSDQIERLFEDIFAGTDRVAAGDNPSTFLGSVIFFADKYAVDPKKANALPTQVFHVVDGQQRLTTLLLVCSSLMRAAHQVLTELDATQVPASEPDPTTMWLREILQAVSGRLLGALHFDDEWAEGSYRFKPRIIRQDSDIWGNTVTDARYESDIAWYLHAIATARAETSAYEPVAVSTHRPHLKLALEAIESALNEVKTGDADCGALSDLAFGPVMRRVAGFLIDQRGHRLGPRRSARYNAAVPALQRSRPSF